MLIKNSVPIEVDIRESPSKSLPPDQLVESVVLEDPRKDYGRTDGARNLPPFLRNTIAVAAQHDKNKNVARAFGISPQEVSLIKNAKIPDGKDEFGKDKVNRDSEINRGIRDSVSEHLAEVRNLATEKLLTALKSMTSERIDSLSKLTESAQFAVSMSKIIESTIAKDLIVGEQAKFVFIIPENRKLVRDYEQVDVEQILD